jgi:hypothetical protein
MFRFLCRNGVGRALDNVTDLVKRGKRTRRGRTPLIGRPKDENLKLRKERRRGIQIVFIYIDRAGSKVTC